MVSPGHKRQVVQSLVARGRCTVRAVCRHFGLHRSTFRYLAKQPDAWLAKLKTALRRVSNTHPELGYPKITQLLKKEGWRVGCRLVQRLRRELGLAVPAKKPQRRRRGVSTGLPTKATHRGHVWTWDFVHDTTMRGGKLRMLNVIDEHTRECLCIYVARRIDGSKVRQVLSDLIDLHGAPEHIRSDNGSEFIEGKLRQWLAENQIKTLDIDLGSPFRGWQNGYVASFNGKLRDELLNGELFLSLAEARYVLDEWRLDYNHRRPHSSVNGQGLRLRGQ